MAGIEICKEIRTIDKFQEIPIIAVSSSPIEGNLEKSLLKEGFNKYISKPINIREFRKVVKDLLT